MSMMTIGQACEMCGGHGAAHDAPVSSVGTDTRVAAPASLFVAIAGPRFDGHEHLDEALAAGAAAAMVRRGTVGPPGLPLIEVDDTRAGLGRLASAWRLQLVNTSVIAVTGTVGKTSTKDTLATVCAVGGEVAASPRSFNNDLGVPLTILAARPHHDVLVAEVGTSGPGEIAPLAAMLAPDVAVVTLVGRGHLAGLGTLAEVAAEKYTLLEALGPDGTGIVRHQAWPLPECAAAVTTFGPEPTADHVLTDRGPGWMAFENRRWEVGLPGGHGALNALAALLAARAIGRPDADIATGLARATASPQRMDVVSIGTVRVIDDTWNANPESVVASLASAREVSNGPLVVVLGDMLELGADEHQHHQALAPHVERLVSTGAVRSVMLIGPAMGSLAGALGAAWTDVERIHEPVGDDACMRRIAQRIRPGDTVLLKASRGVALERVSELLEAEASDSG